MSTPLVLIVLALAAAAGVVGGRRLVPVLPRADVADRALALLVWALVTAAAIVLAMRGYLLVDDLLDVGSAGELAGATVGDVVTREVPEVIFEPGILLGLAFLLLSRLRAAGLSA